MGCQWRGPLMSQKWWEDLPKTQLCVYLFTILYMLSIWKHNCYNHQFRKWTIIDGVITVVFPVVFPEWTDSMRMMTVRCCTMIWVIIGWLMLVIGCEQSGVSLSNSHLGNIMKHERSIERVNYWRFIAVKSWWTWWLLRNAGWWL